jgi:hypothetical protein
MSPHDEITSGRLCLLGAEESTSFEQIPPDGQNREPYTGSDVPPTVASGAQRTSRRRIFTPTAIDTVRELAGQGHSAAQIAFVIGSTAGSVRVMCSNLGISLRQRGRPRLRLTEPHLIQKQMLLSPAVSIALEQKAAQKQQSAARLMEKLLEAIVTSDLYEAVLDE